MRRGVFLMTLVFSLSLAGRAAAVPPHQADIDACNQEAAAAAPMPAASPDEGTTGARTDDSASVAQRTAPPDHAAAVPAERQAFAECLARHGYYKGYYRTGDQPHS